MTLVCSPSPPSPSPTRSPTPEPHRPLITHDTQTPASTKGQGRAPRPHATHSHTPLLEPLQQRGSRHQDHAAHQTKTFQVVPTREPEGVRGAVRETCRPVPAAGGGAGMRMACAPLPGPMRGSGTSRCPVTKHQALLAVGEKCNAMRLSYAKRRTRAHAPITSALKQARGSQARGRGRIS
jgi:hypothetical protein